MSAESSDRFHEQLVGLIKYFRQEFNLTYAELCGVMDIVKIGIALECMDDSVPYDDEEF